MQLRKLAEKIWAAEGTVRLPGLDFPVRAPLVQLANGSLILMSPPPGLGTLRAELEALGPVAAIAAPNMLHHMGVEEAHQAFAKAQLFAGPRLQKKRADISWSAILEPTPPPLWSAELDQLRVEGIPGMEETAFFHRASRSLLLFDLCFNIHHLDGVLPRFGMRLNGAYKRFGPSRLMRRIIRDPRALRKTIDRMRAWEPRRIVVCHGEVLEPDVGGALERAFAFLPK